MRYLIRHNMCLLLDTPQWVVDQTQYVPVIRHKSARVIYIQRPSYRLTAEGRLGLTRKNPVAGVAFFLRGEEYGFPIWGGQSPADYLLRQSRRVAAIASQKRYRPGFGGALQ